MPRLNLLLSNHLLCLSHLSLYIFQPARKPNNSVGAEEIDPGVHVSPDVVKERDSLPPVHPQVPNQEEHMGQGPDQWELQVFGDIKI